ncbi:hypothetical protein KRP22_010730 [Phytophthora ramorum]|nr:hypothetical protein KRP22_5398 [Phytophthora ramorum]
MGWRIRSAGSVFGGTGRWTRSGVVATAAVTSASGRRAARLRRPLDEVGRGGDGGSDIGQRPACRAASKVAGVYLVVHMQMRPLATVGDGLAYSFGRQRVWWHRPLDEVGRGGDGGSDIGQRPACRAASKVAGVYLVVHMQMRPLATVADRWRPLATVGDGLAYSFGRQRVWWHRPLDEVGRGGDGGSDIGQRPACRAASKVAGVYLVVHMQMRPPLDEVGRGGDGGSDIGQRPACRAASKVAGVYLVVHMQMRPLATVGDGLAYSFGRQRVWWHRPLDEVGRGGDGGSDIGQRPACRAASKVAGVYLVVHMQMRPPLDEVGRGGDGGSDIGQRPACRAASKVAGVYLVVHMQMRPLATVGDRWRWVGDRWRWVGDGLAYSFGRQRVWWHRPLDEVGRGGDGGSDIGQRPACRAASKVAGVYLVVHMQMRPLATVGDGWRWVGDGLAYSFGRQRVWWHRPLDEVGRGGDGGSDIGQRPVCRAASKVAGVYLVVHMQMRPLATVGDGLATIGDGLAMGWRIRSAGSVFGGTGRWTRSGVVATAAVTSASGRRAARLRRCDRWRPLATVGDGLAYSFGRQRVWWHRPLDEVGRGGDGGSDIGQRPACRAASKVAGVYLVVHMQMRPLATVGDGLATVGDGLAMGWRIRSASSVFGGTGRWTRSGVVATAAVTSASGRRAARLRRPLDEVGRGGDGGSDIGQRPACRAASKVAGVYLVVHMQMRPPLDEVGRGGDGGSDIGQRPACRAASKVAGVYLVVHMQMRPLATVGDGLATVGDGLAMGWRIRSASSVFGGTGRWTRSGVVATAAVTSASGRRAARLRRPLDEVGRGGDGGSDIGQRPACRAASKVAGVYLVVHMQMRPLATVGDGLATGWRWVGDGLAYSFGRQRVWWHRPLDEVGRGGDGGSDIGQRPACRAASKVAGVYLVVHMQMRPPLDEVGRGGDGGSDIGQRPACRAASKVAGVYLVVHMQMRPLATVGDGPLDEVGRGGDGGSDIGQRPACRAASKVAGVYLVVHMQMRPLATVGDRWRWWRPLAMVGDGLAYSFGRQRVWWHRPLDEVGRGGDGGSDIGQRPACRAASKVAGVYLVVHMQMRPLATVGDGLATGWRWVGDGLAYSFGRQRVWWHRPLDEVGRGGDGGSDIGQRPACRAASKVAGVYLVVHMQMRPLATVGDRWRPLAMGWRIRSAGSVFGGTGRWTRSGVVATAAVTSASGRRAARLRRPLDEVGRGGDGGSDIGQRPACRAASKVAGVYLVVHMQMRPLGDRWRWLATVGDGLAMGWRIRSAGSVFGGTGRWTRSGVVATAAVTSASGRRAARLRRPLDEVGRGGDGGSDIGQRPACRAASKVAGVYLVVHMQMRPLATVGDRWRPLAMGWRIRSAGSVFGGTGRWTRSGVVATAAVTSASGRRAARLRRPLDEVGRGGDGGSDIGQRPACRAASKVAGVYLVVHMQMRPLATVGDRWRPLATVGDGLAYSFGRQRVWWHRPLDEVGRGGDGGSDIGQRPACRAASKVAGVYLVVHMQMRPLATVGDGLATVGDGLAMGWRIRSAGSVFGGTGRWTRSGVVATAAVTSASGRRAARLRRPLDEVGRGGDGGSDISQL